MEKEKLPILEEGRSLDTWAALYKKSVRARVAADKARKRLKKGVVLEEIYLGGVAEPKSLIVNEGVPPKNFLRGLMKREGGVLFVVVDGEGVIFYCLDRNGKGEKFKGKSYPLTEDEFWLLEYKLSFYEVK